MQSRPNTLSRYVLLAASTLLLAACGNKGSLTLPPKPEAAPKKAPAPTATPAPASTPATATAPDHNSTTTTPTSQ